MVKQEQGAESLLNTSFRLVGVAAAFEIFGSFVEVEVAVLALFRTLNSAAGSRNQAALSSTLRGMHLLQEQLSRSREIRYCPKCSAGEML